MRRILAAASAALLLAGYLVTVAAVPVFASCTSWVTLTSNHHDVPLIDNARGGTATAIRHYVGIQGETCNGASFYRKYSQVTILDGLHAKLRTAANNQPCGDDVTAYSTTGSSLITYGPTTALMGAGGCNEGTVTDGPITFGIHQTANYVEGDSFANDLTPNGGAAWSYVLAQTSCGPIDCPGYGNYYDSPLTVNWP